jgi:hypothetical protein
MEWGDHIELSGTTDAKHWAKLVADQLVNSIEHLEGLENLPLTIDWRVTQLDKSDDVTGGHMGAFIDQTLATFEAMALAIADLRQRVEGLEKGALTEVDRSHDVVIGARVDSGHSGF